MAKREDILEFESETRVGPYVFLERVPECEGPRYQVRIERPWKNYKWNYNDREKGFAHWVDICRSV